MPIKIKKKKKEIIDFNGRIELPIKKKREIIDFNGRI